MSSQSTNTTAYKPPKRRLVWLCLGVSSLLIASQFVFNERVTIYSTVWRMGRGLEHEQAKVQFLKQESHLDARELVHSQHEQRQKKKTRLMKLDSLRKTAVASIKSELRKKTSKHRISHHKEDKKDRVVKEKSIRPQALEANDSRHAKNPPSHLHHKKKKELDAKALRKRTVQDKNLSVTFTADKIPAANQTEIECLAPREPIWDRYDYVTQQDKEKPKGSQRLLIGLYSGFGTYAHLLSTTARINRAYALHWHHDLVVVQGAALKLPDLDGDCEPPPHRATYNKIPLLRLALEQKDKYDQLLILDTDAIVYDFDFDVTTLLPNTNLLAAQKVHLNDGLGRQTWDVNAGVTLWNLHHPLVEQVADEWYNNSKRGMARDWHASNDQFHLHYTLKQGGYDQHVRGLDEEFNYGHGTVIKHFIRKPGNKQWGKSAILDNREDRIEEAIEQVCQKHHRLCQAVEKSVYAER